MFRLFAHRYLFIALIILFLTWVMFVTSHPLNEEGRIEYFLNSAMAPLESIFGYIGHSVGDGWNTVSRLGQLKKENEQLTREIKLLKTRELGFNSLRQENQRLREALHFQAVEPHELVSAEIIGTNPSNYKQTVWINRGKNDGLRKGMAVITPDGVVGRLNDVRDFTSEIILITDPRDGNSIGGVLDRSKTTVIVSGGGFYQGQCTVRPAIDSYFVDVKKKDIVVTAENSDIFPRGIPIGRISFTSKSSNQMINEAALNPVVDFGKLQMVYVIKVKKDVAPTATNSGG